jgi:hypothetical protein
MKQQLIQSNANITYEDNYLGDFVILETEDIESVRSLGCVKDIEKSAIYVLQDIPKVHSHRLKAIPNPIIDNKPLANLGRYGLGTSVAIIDSGFDPEANGSIELAENFTTAVTTEDTIGHGRIVIALVKNFDQRQRYILLKFQ